jgi:hypothetical protein
MPRLIPALVACVLSLAACSRGAPAPASGQVSGQVPGQVSGQVSEAEPQEDQRTLLHLVAVAASGAELNAEDDGTVTLSSGHMRARLGPRAAGLEVLPPELAGLPPDLEPPTLLATKDGRIGSWPGAWRPRGIVSRGRALIQSSRYARMGAVLHGDASEEANLPGDCAREPVFASSRANVRLCRVWESLSSSETFSHVVMRGDTYGERVPLPVTDAWHLQVLPFARGHYLYVRSNWRAPELYQLGPGVWTAVPLPASIDEHVVAADAEGRVLALEYGKLRRWAPGSDLVETIEVAPTADHRPQVPLYVASQDVAVGTLDMSFEDLGLSNLVVARDGTLYVTAHKEHGTYLLSTRPVGQPVVVPSPIDQMARLDNMKEPEPLTADCQEFFVRAENVPEGASENERLLALRQEARETIPDGITSTAVAGRLHGEFVRGVILTGPGAADVAISLATDLAHNPAQPSPPVCTMPELLAVAQ